MSHTLGASDSLLELLCVQGQGVPQVFFRDRYCRMPEPALKPPQAVGGVRFSERMAQVVKAIHGLDPPFRYQPLTQPL